MDMQNNIDAQQTDHLPTVQPRPKCGKRALRPGVNDLATTHPEVAAQWDDELNEGLTPNRVLAGSSKKVWWRCEENHTWQARVLSRVQRKSGCPYCSRRMVIPGENDLATCYPEIAALWDEELNDGLKPNQVLPGSNKRVWWKCEKGHTWQAMVKGRVQLKSGCPYCANRKEISEENSLATCYPEVAALWDEELNDGLKPNQVLPASNKKVWWKCEKGHSWQTAIFAVAKNGTRCPCCAGKKVSPGENDLATRYPDIAKRWDTEKNDIAPSQVMPASKKKYWWRCEQGHTWQAAVHAMTLLNSGCPYCSGRKVIPGKTDLATRFPNKAAWWAEDLNDGVPATEIAPTSRKMAWWRCEEGHCWEAQVFSVTSDKSDCPECAQKRTEAGRIAREKTSL